MYYDVLVIGGGPAGAATARDIARKGYRVAILEKQAISEWRMQCSGLISPRSVELAGYHGPSFGVLHGAQLHSPSGHTLSFRSSKVYAVAVDRVALDQELLRQAREAGAEVILGAKAESFRYLPDGVEVSGCLDRSRTNSFNYQAKLIIGADGVNSKVAKWLGLFPGERVAMAAAEVRLGPNNQAVNSQAEIFLGEDLAPGWFGWLFPVGPGIARVGIGRARGEQSPVSFLHRLFERYPQYFEGCEILQRTSGVVPIGPVPKIFNERVLLVGDAAAQVKPISGGGLYLGLKAASLAAETACRALENGDLSCNALSAYQKTWEPLSREILSGLSLRKFFLELSENEIDLMVCFFNRPFWIKLIAGQADIDYPSRLAAAINKVGKTSAGLLNFSHLLSGIAQSSLQGINTVLQDWWLGGFGFRDKQAQSAEKQG